MADNKKAAALHSKAAAFFPEVTYDKRNRRMNLLYLPALGLVLLFVLLPLGYIRKDILL